MLRCFIRQPRMTISPPAAPRPIDWCSCSSSTSDAVSSNEYLPGDHWGDPDATAIVGAPALPEPRRDPTKSERAKFRTREVVFGGKASHLSLAILAITAMLIGFAGGVIGRKTAQVGAVLTNSHVTLSGGGDAPPTPSVFAKVAAAAEKSVVEIVATSGDLFE